LICSIVYRVATDADVAALRRLSQRSDDDLLALVGILDESPNVAADAIMRILDPELAESFEEDGLLPRFDLNLQQLRDKGRARVERFLSDRRRELQTLICPIATGGDAERDLLITLGPATLADAVVHTGGEPNAALLAMVAYLLTRTVNELCSDWQPPSGGAQPAIS
jgi:hypothetical protein